MPAADLQLLTDDRIDRDGPHWPDRTLLSYLKAAVAEHETKPAVVGPRRSYTYGDLASMSDRIAGEMAADGISAGDVVTVQLPNWAEAVPLRLAIMKLGAVAHLMPVFYRADDIAYQLELMESAAYVAARSFDGHDFVGMVRDSLSFDGRLYAVDRDPTRTDGPGDATPFTRLEAHDPDRDRDWPGLDPATDVSHVLFTGGTTGTPKGVVHTENSTVSWIAPYSDRTGYGADSRNLVPSTIGHGAGYLWATYLPIGNGATAYLMDSWDGTAGLEAIRTNRITHMYAIPTFIHDLLEAHDGTDADVSSVENLSCGGATVPRPMIREAQDTFGCSVCAGWGQTEDWLTTLTHPDDPPEKIHGTDGYPMGGMEIRVEDPDDEFPGDTGRLLVRGPWLMMGFYRQPAVLERSMRDGWYVTGDLARIDADGYVVITGREKDVIIRGGENVPVATIEDLLYEHPAIDEVAVVAMPDDRLGERACAFVDVVDGETLTMKDLLDFLDERDLTTQYYPEQLQLVESLPKTSLGKIDRLALREHIADLLGKDPV